MISLVSGARFGCTPLSQQDIFSYNCSEVSCDSVEDIAVMVAKIVTNHVCIEQCDVWRGMVVKAGLLASVR